MKRKYMKWILRLDREMSNYILAKETEMRDLRLEAMRKVKYEETSDEKEDSSELYKGTRERGKK